MKKERPVRKSAGFFWQTIGHECSVPKKKKPQAPTLLRTGRTLPALSQARKQLLHDSWRDTYMVLLVGLTTFRKLLRTLPAQVLSTLAEQVRGILGTLCNGRCGPMTGQLQRIRTRCFFPLDADSARQCVVPLHGKDQVHEIQAVLLGRPNVKTTASLLACRDMHMDDSPIMHIALCSRECGD